jgi:signal transduction histidine kinase/ligand-binding sensor domain-containing protein
VFDTNTRMKVASRPSQNKQTTVFIFVSILGLVFTACSTKETLIPAFPFYSVGQQSVQENVADRLSPIAVEDISFRNLTIKNGLSQSSVLCIFQDSLGYLWFCTYEGADRYDGYEFVNFAHDPQNPNSLRDNLVTAIAEDSQGDLWFGTQIGLDKFNPKTGEISHISLDSDEAVLISSLLADPDGNLWVGSYQGIFCLETENGQILKTTHFDLLDVGGARVNENVVGAIFQDSLGTIWVGAKLGLGRYDIQTDSFTWELTKSVMVESAVTQSIVEIEPGELLLGGGYGLLFFDIQRNITTSISSDRVIYPSARRNFNMVWSIFRADDGYFWLGTDIGLIRMEPDLKYGFFFPQIQENPDTMETVASVFQDREGNIWVGSHTHGLFIYQPLSRKFEPPEPYIEEEIKHEDILGLYEDRLGFLWLGTDHELLKIDRVEQQIESYPYQPDQGENQVDSRVGAILEGASGNLWFGTAAGSIYFYDREKDSFIRAFVESITPGYPILLFYLDRDGDMLIGTAYGLYWHRKDQGSLSHFINDPNDPNTISNNYVMLIREDENGNIWVGTRDGLNTFNKATGLFSRLDFKLTDDTTKDNTTIVDHSIISILPDSSGGLWLGSLSGGLKYLDVSTGKLTVYQDLEGITVGTIYSILRDREGNLWLSTNRGLCKFNPESGVFTNYTYEDGLPNNEFNQSAYFQSASGELIYGGIDGLVYFYPEEILQNNYSPPIVLTKIAQNGKNILSGFPSDHVDSLTLTWPNNYFEFEFAALSFAKPEDNQYAYYLEGIDPAWVYAGKNHSGRYVNLPGGTYTLHLIGSNSDGIWNTDGKKIQITVIPPLWQQFWFQAAVLLAILGLAFWGYRYRVRSILSRSNELERLVNERTADLSRINERLLGEIAERERAENQLSQRIASEAILTERNRLARDLHDAVTQTIFSASILSETLPHSLKVNPKKGQQQLEELQQLTRGALAELRSLLFELRPEGLVKTDLKELLAQLGKGTTGRTGIPVELDCDTQVDIPSEIKITLYRIAQEALNNASRHADPSRIRIVCIGTQEFIRLSIQDDGKGFELSKKLESRLGLGIMQERATDIGATLIVNTQPGMGTNISVEWYFPQNGDSNE